MSQGGEMETYEAAYRDLMSSPVPREGLPLSLGGSRNKVEMSSPMSDDDDPYARLVRELDTIPVYWFL